MGVGSAGAERRSRPRRGGMVAAHLVAVVVVVSALGVVPVPELAHAQQIDGDQADKVIEVFAVGGQSNAAPINPVAVDQKMAEIIGPDNDDRMIAVVRSGSMGGSVTNRWYGDGTASTEDDGAEYLRFQQRVHDLIDELSAEYPEHEVRFSGMWWHQGEGDSRIDYAPHYEANLRHLIQDIRVTFDAPELKVILARITDRSPEGWQMVRQAQVAIGASDLHAYTVELDDLAHHLRDAVHYTATGYELIIERFVTTYAEITRDWPTCGTYLIEPGECVRAEVAAACVANQPVVTVAATTLQDRPATLTMSIDGEPQANTAEVDSQTPASLTSGPVVAATRHVVITANQALVSEADVDVRECDFVLGDVDDSGQLDPEDVSAVLAHLVGILGAGGIGEPSHIHRSDADGSGQVGLNDARMLAQLLGDAVP